MSQLMLDDKNTMDDMNPFVNFMPGSSRQPHAFGDYKPPVDEPEEEPYKSPACNVVSKNVGRPGYRSKKCDLSRPLLPGRNIDKGFTNFESHINMEKVKKAVKAGTSNNFIMNLISLLCLILLIVTF
jgi:hypothetical protein|tara:strand:- start:160 stop:540 length:381 start_codon:yes stop_codon:yes gene_type:complete